MVVQHVLAFSLAPGLSPEEQKSTFDAIFKLQSTCARPDGTLYIRSIKGGKQNSKEGMDKGIEWVFVVEFENEKDRDYYVEADPVHAALGSSLKTKVAAITVLDFTVGVF
ncbi:hypothetical protein HDZ31DRAFT_82840 [Schizophyllum fasciatum]